MPLSKLMRQNLDAVACITLYQRVTLTNHGHAGDTRASAPTP